MCGRKLEPQHRQTQDLGDPVWANEPGCQLSWGWKMQSRTRDQTRDQPPPVKSPWLRGAWEEEWNGPPWRNPSWHCAFLQSLIYLSFDVPGEGCHYHLFAKNGVNWFFLPWGLEQMGECIGLDIFGPGSVRQGEIESPKEEGPASLSGAQPPGQKNIFKLFWSVQTRCILYR